MKMREVIVTAGIVLFLAVFCALVIWPPQFLAWVGNLPGDVTVGSLYLPFSSFFGAVFLLTALGLTVERFQKMRKSRQ
jgi:hypothetical protein